MFLCAFLCIAVAEVDAASLVGKVIEVNSGDVITIAGFHFASIVASSSSRGLERWTIRLQANGADGRSGCSASCLSSASVISWSHSSS